MELFFFRFLFVFFSFFRSLLPMIAVRFGDSQLCTGYVCIISLYYSPLPVARVCNNGEFTFGAWKVINHPCHLDIE